MQKIWSNDTAKISCYQNWAGESSYICCDVLYFVVICTILCLKHVQVIRCTRNSNLANQDPNQLIQHFLMKAIPILLVFSFFLSLAKMKDLDQSVSHPHMSPWITLGQQHVSPDHLTEAHIYSKLEELRAQFKDM